MTYVNLALIIALVICCCALQFLIASLVFFPFIGGIYKEAHLFGKILSVCWVVASFSIWVVLNLALLELFGVI